ncbi:DNA topoisomerase IB [Novosphingobium malaysiense]|uniref:DNA topoisomerase n=1 Tax=Novosphingobium malaysiense TaxID=1348853 RepID=A0A0B1ZKQ2_9SPHN|nr:DNA topoisomerase IB [Novosphingobium malaysiense]KHK91106.1 DNA topoisomerase [Novosphingobium malaysiense]
MRYADTDAPAITRRKHCDAWIYLDAEGRRISDPDEIERLDAIGLPPAYTDCWFASDPDTHIQATGIDARGRKQYVYHPDYVAQRDARKFGGCAGFGRLLPRIRKRVDEDLAKRTLIRERAVASIVRLLDSGRIRVGSEAYARSNRSFGATTLRQRHAQIRRNRVDLRFRAKSGRLCEMSVTDRGLLRFVKQVQDLPGQHLFQYRDNAGEFHPVNSADVNDYIHETMGEAYTAKDFRTWRASVLAFEWLTRSEGHRTLREMLAHVAEHLGNTPAVARKSYVHPDLIEMVRSGDLAEIPDTLPRRTKWLARAERGLIDLLQEESCSGAKDSAS